MRALFQIISLFYCYPTVVSTNYSFFHFILQMALIAMNNIYDKKMATILAISYENRSLNTFLKCVFAIIRVFCKVRFFVLRE